VNILTIDTAGAVTALAVTTEARLIGESFLHTEHPHSERLLPLIEQLLDSCALRPPDLDLIGVARGPGSFTGIRIGIATAQGIAQVLGIPVLGLCSLDIISWAGWARSEDIVVLLGARKNEWYMARYRWRKDTAQTDGALWRREVVEAPQALAERELPARLAARPSAVLLAGEGAERAGLQVTNHLDAPVQVLSGAAGLTRGLYAAREIRTLLAADSTSGYAAEMPAGGASWQVAPYYIRLPEAEVRRQARAAKEAGDE
jgi:tRNA threonylcarbamoyladenosine biosynthesis protein TsaB